MARLLPQPARLNPLSVDNLGSADCPTEHGTKVEDGQPEWHAPNNVTGQSKEEPPRTMLERNGITFVMIIVGAACRSLDHSV
jgi:hypothetical protein